MGVADFPFSLRVRPACSPYPAVCVAHVTVWVISCLYSQIIARGLLDIFRDFGNDEEDFLTVMAIVVRLSEDAGLYKECAPLLVFVRFYNQRQPT